MKKWTGSLIALAIIILGAYYVMGWVAERTLSHNIKALPESPLFNVSLDKYQRGWFSSHALLRFKLHIPPQSTMGSDGVAKMGQPIDLSVGFPLLIQHGPVVCTDSGLRFGMAQITTRPATHYGAFINYFNHTILKYTLPAMSLHTEMPSPEGGYQLDWKGMRVWLSLSSHLRGFRSDLKLGGLTISARDFAIKVGKIVSETESSRYREWLWVGQTHFYLPSITAHAASQKQFELKDFDLTVTSNVEEENLRFDWQFSLQKLFADKQNYGPAFLKLSIRNVDAEAMAKINQQIWNSTAQSTGHPEMAMMAAMMEMPKLLAKGPIIELSEMDLTMPEGKIIGHFKFILPKVSPQDSTFARQIRGEGQFKAPVKVVKALLIASLKRHAAPVIPSAASREQALTLDAAGNQVPSTNDTSDYEQQADKILNEYVSKGILKLEGTDYVLTFKVEDEKLIVNGQVFNP